VHRGPLTQGYVVVVTARYCGADRLTGKPARFTVELQRPGGRDLFPDLDLEATVAVQAMVIDQLLEANARLVGPMRYLRPGSLSLSGAWARILPIPPGHRRRTGLESRPRRGSSGVVVGAGPASSPVRRARTGPRCPTRARWL
jgi:hypothetical protein